jgi:hypothetical protein
VIFNAFAKANEMAITMLMGFMALKDFSGTIVIIANTPECQIDTSLL